jgi:GAF domain
MPARSVTELEALLDQLEKKAEPLRSEDLDSVSSAIAKLFGVEPDEVAILELHVASKALKFVLPEKLRPVGSIPLTSSAALAARTAREGRSDVVNNFAQSRHASVFEGVPLGRRQGVCIQKLMSAPILRNGEALGVVQISRKGESQQDCGPDFKAADLKALQGLSDLLARFLALVRAA